MFASLSHILLEDKIYYRVEFIDGRTMLFEEYEEAIDFLNDKGTYNFIMNRGA